MANITISDMEVGDDFTPKRKITIEINLEDVYDFGKEVTIKKLIKEFEDFLRADCKQVQK